MSELYKMELIHQQVLIDNNHIHARNITTPEQGVAKWMASTGVTPEECQTFLDAPKTDREAVFDKIMRVGETPS